MRTPLIAGNWKMFKGVADAVAYAKEFRALAKDLTDVEVVVAPPFTAVHGVADAVGNPHWRVGQTFTANARAPSPARSARRCSRRPAPSGSSSGIASVASLR